MKCLLVSMLCLLILAVGGVLAHPPICPHVIGWNSDINTWAQGAPWIKVIYSTDIVSAQGTGAKVFYRPWDADSTNHDDGNLPAGQTGSQYADLVWARISGLATKPTAVGYRNEFNWDNPTAAKRTCAEFVNYKNRLRALGYTGKVIFGSFGVGWVDSYVWDDSDCRAATDAADGIETHEYFDLTVACCSPWLAFRHRDIAIADHPDHLGSKEWYIGEFGSDRVCGNCSDCDDDLCRRGWRDNNKLTEAAYIDQLSAYRTGCSDQVQAVFLFQQGSGSWADFEVVGTSVATWMKGTWPTTTTTNLSRSANIYLECGHNDVSQRGKYLVDGNTGTKWCCLHNGIWTGGDHWIAFDLGSTSSVSQYVVKHASMGGETTAYNTKTFYIESASSMMGPWSQEFYVDNATTVASNTLTYGTPKSLRYIRLRITKPNPSSDWAVRIPEFEIWGTAGAAQAVKIEAENYDRFYGAAEGTEYHDTDSGNTGGAYRSQNVDIESCGEGTYNVGWIASGEWLIYPFNATRTTYNLTIRYAGTANGTCRVYVDGVDKTGAISLPSTGAWQTYTTKTVGNISVSTGWHDIKFQMESAGFNVNYFTLTP